MHFCRCDHGLGTQGLFGRNPRKSLCVSFFLFSLLFADTQGFVRESCRASKSLCVRPLLIVLLSEPEHIKNCAEFSLTSLRLQNPACQAGLVAHKPSNPCVFFLCVFFFFPRHRQGTRREYNAKRCSGRGCRTQGPHPPLL